MAIVLEQGCIVKNPNRGVVALSHEAVVTGGQPAVTDETTEAGFFGPVEIEGMALMAHDWERIADALAVVPEVFVR